VDHFGHQADKGGFARSAQGEVAHADDFAGKRLGPVDPFPVEENPGRYRPAVKEGEDREGGEQDFLKLTFSGIADEAMQEVFQFGP
jgi:hypothetical protein